MLGYLAGALLRSVLRLAYARRQQYITVQPIRLPPDGTTTAGHADDIDCVVVDSVEALARLAPRFPPEFRDSAHRLQRRLAQGCVLSLARRRDAHGASHVVGYELAERGLFSALGRRRAVYPDVVFSHWAEVLPAYRGRRIHARLFAARDAYFAARGASIVVGVVSPRNHASLRALERAGSWIAGKVERVEVLGGLLRWETPWERIDEALRTGAVRATSGAAAPPRESGAAFDVSRTSEPSSPPLRLSSPETPR